LDVGSQNRDAPQDESIRTKTKFIRQLFANEGGVTQFDLDSQTPYSHTSTFLLSRDVLVAGGVHSFERIVSRAQNSALAGNPENWNLLAYVCPATPWEWRMLQSYQNTTRGRE